MYLAFDVSSILSRINFLVEHSYYASDVKDKYIQLINELKYLEIYLWCVEMWDGKMRDFVFVEISSINHALGEALTKYGFPGEKTFDHVGEKTFDHVDLLLLKTIQQCKRRIPKICFNFLDSPFNCLVPIAEFRNFMSLVSTSLGNLLRLKVDMKLDVKLQIETLQENLEFFQEVFAFAEKQSNSLICFEIDTEASAWPYCAACVSLLYWVLDAKKEIKAQKMDDILLDLRKKISPTVVDFIWVGLPCQLRDSSFPSDIDDIFSQVMYELGYLKLYMICSSKWKDSFDGRDKNFGFVEESHMEAAIEEAAKKYIKSGCEFKAIDIVDFSLLEKVQQSKLKIREDCLKFIDFPFKCEFSIEELTKLMSSMSKFLRNFLKLKVVMVFDLKVEIESYLENLDLCKEIFDFSYTLCTTDSLAHQDRILNFEDFKAHIECWTCNVACILLLYWTQDFKKENMTQRADVVLSDLQGRISSFAQDLTGMYLVVLRARPTKDGIRVRELLSEFVVFLNKILQVHQKNVGDQMLFIELIFLLTFLADLTEDEKLAEGKLIAAQAVTELVVFLISPSHPGQIKEGISEYTFLQKANAIKVEVRKLYAHLFPDPSSFNFPSINILGFIDSLLEKLREMCNHFPNYPIMMLHEELLSLKELNLEVFSGIELQNKHKDVKDIWTRIVNVVYNAERVSYSVIYMNEILWHDLLYLSEVTEEVKLIRVEVKRIQDKNMSDICALNSKRCRNLIPPLHVMIQVPTETGIIEVVGLKDEADEIRYQLTGASEELHIVSIFGMPGSGKTTLAKKVYYDASIRCHFHKYAWCAVSQTFNAKRIFMEILSGGTHYKIDDISNQEEEDLAERVYRSLKGQRYLIVLDDIWDDVAWKELEMSLPRDKNGSRIIFTSRIRDVVLEPKSASYTTFPTRPLSDEKSWELLEKKLFDRGCCPSDFVQIGKQIAANCKGLPLSIVLIAGVLKEKIHSLDWWKEIGKTLNSLIAKDDCKNVLDLSYKHLPEYLKNCFLYFGIFQEDEEIMVKKLTSFWISEGFVQKHENKSLEVMAEEYLMDLVSRSLVIITKRSSAGRIKACSVHDLLHDFCTAKGEEENLIKVIRGGEDFMAATNARYRVCIQNDCWTSFLEDSLPASSVHSLLYLRSSRFEEAGSLSYFKFLHVLDLDVTFCEFPEELIRLRHLAINFEDSSIPPTINRLVNLETLCLYSRRRRYKLPLELWELQKLRHVSGLVKIPTGLRRKNPLENVQTFSLPSLDNDNAEFFFRTIPQVRKLKFEFRLMGDHSSSLQIVKFDIQTHLESLSIRQSESTHHKMQISSCPFSFPSTLKKLSLTGFRLPWYQISPITQLPNLEILKLRNSFRGKTWNVGDEEFLKLKCLMLIGLDIEEMSASEESFPCLERLVVRFCKNLEEIPPRFASILTLKTIQARDCSSTLISSVMQIQEEQVELGNEHLDVLIH